MHPHSESLLRISRLPRRLPISRSAWWAGVKQNKYSADIKVSPCVTVVMSGSIDELILQLAQLGRVINCPAYSALEYRGDWLI